MRKDPLPAEFAAYIRNLFLRDPRHNIRRIHRWIIIRWCLWADGIEANAMPGYATCPPEDPRTGFPAGWSVRNFSDLCREAIGTATIAAARGRAAAIHH